MKRLPENWDGKLTTRNIQQVASRLRQLLEGKRFTFATVEVPSLNLEVQIHQELGAD